MDAREDEPDTAAPAGRRDGDDDPAGRLEPAERQLSGRRAAVLAGLMIVAVAVGDIGISGTLPSGVHL